MSKEREVSEKIISTNDACNWNLTVGGLKDYDHVYVNGIRYTEYQSDVNTQYLLDQVARLTAENAMIKEKWSEAQPESFMFKDRELTGSLIAHDDMYKKGYAQAGLDLKREPLSDYATYDMFRASKQAVTASCYWAGIRDAEKAHGIGCGE